MAPDRTVCNAAHVFEDQAHRARALEICDALHCWCINHKTHIPYLGDWVLAAGASGRMDATHDNFADISRPSDWCLTHFRLFQQVPAVSTSPLF